MRIIIITYGQNSFFKRNQADPELFHFTLLISRRLWQQFCHVNSLLKQTK